MSENVQQSIRQSIEQSTQQVVKPVLSAPEKPRKVFRYNWLPLIVAIGVLAIWYLLTRDNTETFAVAPPQAVIQILIADLVNGSLLRNAGTTLLEIGIGFVLGVGIAFILGYGIAHNRLLERAIGPYAVGFQAVPIIAIAPVLIILVGPGIPSNAIICALIVFFPMLVSTIVAMRNIDPNLRDLMRALKATRWQTFTRLELPASLPILFGGLKISATLAVIGAVVGEAVSSQAGLGYMIYYARYTYNATQSEAGVFALTALALLLYEIVARLERRLLRWQHAGH